MKGVINFEGSYFSVKEDGKYIIIEDLKTYVKMKFEKGNFNDSQQTFVPKGRKFYPLQLAEILRKFGEIAYKLQSIENKETEQ